MDLARSHNGCGTRRHLVLFRVLLLTPPFPRIALAMLPAVVLLGSFPFGGVLIYIVGYRLLLIYGIGLSHPGSVYSPWRWLPMVVYLGGLGLPPSIF